MPGVRRVGVIVTEPSTYGLHAGADYGLLESVVGNDDLHHEVAGRAAFALQPLDWLALGVRFDALYVKHSGGADDGDSGALTRTRVGARVGGALSDRIRLGGELRLRVPAAQSASDAFRGTSVDLRALLTYAHGDGRLLLSSVLGARLDHTRSAVPQPLGYTTSDRVVLGVANGTAVQTGLAATYRMDAIDLLGEWTWDLYTGSSAPSVGQSPMWLTGGARYWLAEAMHADFIVSVSPSARPDVQDDFVPVVIEPRFWLGAAFGMQFGRPAAPVVEEPSAPPPPPKEVAPGSVEGQVRGVDGEAIGGATVSYQTPEGPQQVVADGEGKFQLTSVPPGPLELSIEAEGYEPFKQLVQVAEGKAIASEVLLQRPLPEGQIRGTVKDYKGRPVAAKIRIKPLGKSLRADANGEFEIDVPPGDYTVVVTADGFRSQRRPAKVHDNGVTVVIVDLRKKR